MKYLSFLLLTFTAEASVFEYREVSRTYKNLEKLDLTACGRSFRFINNNWMDCQFHLPGLINSAVGQISHFPVNKRELSTALPEGLNYVTSLETGHRDADEAASGIKLTARTYYQRWGDSTIHSGPSHLYTSQIFLEKLREALSGWRPSASTIAAYDPSLSSPFFDDEIKGRVFFGEKIVSPDPVRCLEEYEHDQEDNWPDDEVIYYSQCSYSEEKKFFPLNLTSFWSQKLRNLPVTEIKIIPLSGGKVARVSSSPEGISIQLGHDSGTGPDFNLDLTKEEATPLIHEAAKMAGTMKPHFFILERNLNSLTSGERILGKLVLKRTRMKDEIDVVEAR